jgi:hypothetical protein
VPSHGLRLPCASLQSSRFPRLEPFLLEEANSTASQKAARNGRKALITDVASRCQFRPICASLRGHFRYA